MAIELKFNLYCDVLTLDGRFAEAFKFQTTGHQSHISSALFSLRRMGTDVPSLYPTQFVTGLINVFPLNIYLSVDRLMLTSSYIRGHFEKCLTTELVPVEGSMLQSPVYTVSSRNAKLLHPRCSVCAVVAWLVTCAGLGGERSPQPAARQPQLQQPRSLSSFAINKEKAQ